MSATNTQDGLPPRLRLWAVLALVFAIAMAALDSSIANTALPTIAADVNATPASSVWVVNAYQLVLVATLLPFASLGEIFGYRRIYMLGLVVFTLGSLLCALSWSLPSLTAARVLQAFGASGVLSVNTALIRFIYPARSLGKGLGFNALVVAVSTAAGPTFAAGVLSVASWQYLFAVNVPFGVVALVLGLRSLPATPRAAHRFDVASAALNAATFGLLIFGIGEAAHKADRATVMAVLAGFLVSGYFLVRRQLSLTAPLLPLDLYRRPMFALSSATSMFSFTAWGLAFVSLPFFFQTVLGHSAVQTGLLLTPWPVATAIMAPIAGPLSDRYPPAILGGIGMAMLCAGLVLMAALPGEPTTLGIVLRMLLCGAGFGFFQSPNLKAIMSSAPAARSGSASGIVATSRLVGQALGAALVALCFGIAGSHGPVVALGLGAGFAGVASVISFSRLLPGSGLRTATGAAD
jgi:DHA2 family multidrug resistance protein-like MFS transporter